MRRVRKGSGTNGSRASQQQEKGGWEVVGYSSQGKRGMAEASELALRMNIDDLNCSEGWLRSFKQRRGLAQHTVSGEAGAVSQGSSGIFYNLLPDKTLAVKGDYCVGSKRSKERLAVLLCANMDGSKRLKPFVIGKFAKLRAFCGARNIPCTYDSNKKA
ncbi:hypothetical protein PR048_003993 [Dryococelus australis]|uniref:DDE-1 domain-containing protein n=1 Tax=Dryococelus australis TaxID=614101 RepID=A0ABQ9I476_9NEOP|nr:hypothetical protein PR048_003993 [Dryococelus australis]